MRERGMDGCWARRDQYPVAAAALPACLSYTLSRGTLRTYIHTRFFFPLKPNEHKQAFILFSFSLFFFFFFTNIFFPLYFPYYTSLFLSLSTIFIYSYTLYSKNLSSILILEHYFFVGTKKRRKKRTTAKYINL
jgi:hypothetical protein